MDAIKYVSGLVLAVIVISIVMGMLYMLSNNWQNQATDSGEQNANMLDCVQQNDRSYADCKDEYSQSSTQPAENLMTEVIAT